MMRVRTLLLLVVAAGLKQAAAQAPPTLVVTDTVTSQSFHQQITLVGRSEGQATSQVVSEVAGRVATIVAAEGNPVQRGAALIEIDSDRLRLDLAAKEAEVIEAKEQMELARTNLKRTEELFGKNLSREISLDSAKAWVNITEARHRRISAERDRLAKDVDDCRVKAPYTGYTSRKLVNPGEWVNRGTPVFEMTDISKLRIAVDLPERYFGRLSIGSPASIVASSDTTNPLPGVVTGQARSASAATHSFPVIITVDNPDGRIGSGALVRATLSLDEVFTSLAVPKDALVRQGNMTMVYTIAEGKAAPIPVMASAADGQMVAIAGQGVAVGMPVVVRGNERIFPGSPVRTADAPPDGGASGTTP